MFARFRNIFSKAKTDEHSSDVTVEEETKNLNGDNSKVDEVKENENIEPIFKTIGDLKREKEKSIEREIRLKENERNKIQDLNNTTTTIITDIKDHKEDGEKREKIEKVDENIIEDYQEDCREAPEQKEISEIIEKDYDDVRNMHNQESNEKRNIEAKSSPKELDNTFEEVTKFSEKDYDDIKNVNNENNKKEEKENSIKTPDESVTVKSAEQINIKMSNETMQLPQDPNENIIKANTEIDLSPINANTASTHSENSQKIINSNNSNINDKTLTDSSVVVEEIANDTTMQTTNDKSQSTTTTNDGDQTIVETANDIVGKTIIVNPVGNNDMACTAISNKLKEISQVAESLDAVIRDVQSGSLDDALETNSSSNEKKLETLRCNSSSGGEDWHSRSTEDESFATASEGNFTPHSHSSSYQTASGRTSSHISSGKNSFDASSEAEDSTYAFDMPELTSPINMSFDSSEHSFLSAQEPLTPHESPLEDADDNSDGACGGVGGNDVADVEEMHSQSVTPTPGDNYHEGIPIESETELESCIADAPSMEILTENIPMTSVTPEVSSCSNFSHLSTHATNSAAPTNNKPPNAAWRRSKYYENITKQTIKGFL